VQSAEGGIGAQAFCEVQAANSNVTAASAHVSRHADRTSGMVFRRSRPSGQ